MERVGLFSLSRLDTEWFGRGEEEDGERGKRPLPLPLLPALLPKPTPPSFLCDSDGGPNFICPDDIQMAKWEGEAGAAAG